MSNAIEAVRIAFRKGYRVSDSGEVTNAMGRVRKCRLKCDNTRARDKYYRVFNVGVGDGQRFPVMVHRLAAYQKFGEDAFAPGAHTRHLDGDRLNNRPDNIAMGSPTDNAMDRPPKERAEHAQKAGKAASPYTDEVWQQVKDDYAAGLGYKKLRSKYGIPLGTLSYQLSKTAKRTVMV